jgi:hypothetical protein
MRDGRHARPSNQIRWPLKGKPQLWYETNLAPDHREAFG